MRRVKQKMRILRVNYLRNDFFEERETSNAGKNSAAHFLSADCDLCFSGSSDEIGGNEHSNLIAAPLAVKMFGK